MACIRLVLRALCANFPPGGTGCCRYSGQSSGMVVGVPVNALSQSRQVRLAPYLPGIETHISGNREENAGNNKNRRGGSGNFVNIPPKARPGCNNSGLLCIEKLFKPILEDVIIPFEVKRILEYPFTQDATLVFVQKISSQRV